MSDDPVSHVVEAQSAAAKRGALAIWVVYDRPDDRVAPASIVRIASPGEI